jgi:hypothetical protein
MEAVMPTSKSRAPVQQEEDEEEEEEEEVVEAPVVPKKVSAPAKRVVKKVSK